MENETLHFKVTTIIGEHMSIKPITIKPTDNLRDDLGADSMDMIELIILLEDEFNIEVTDEEAESLNLVSDWVNLVNEKINANLAGGGR